MGASEISLEPISNPWWTAARWALRIGVCLQAMGLWRLLTGFDDTPLFEWLWLGEEGGGLGWSEAQAMALQHRLGWVMLASGLFTLLRPSLLTTGPILIVESLLVFAMWKTNFGYSLDFVVIPPELERWYHLPAQMCRVVAPLSLIMLDPFWGCWRKETTSGPTRIRSYLGVQLLRLAIAGTFAAHGLKALQKSGNFVDLILDTAKRIFAWDIPQAVAEQSLVTIGTVDMISAALCLLTRSRLVLYWLAFWGLLTAASRITAAGWTFHWHETAWRAPHAFVPLAIAFYWTALRKRPI